MTCAVCYMFMPVYNIYMSQIKFRNINSLARYFCLQEAQVYENRTKIEGFINIFIEHILFTQPGFKGKL